MNKPNPAIAIFTLGFAAVLSVSGCAATDQNLGQAVPAAIEGQRGQVHEWAIDNNASAILALSVGDPRISAREENGWTPLHWAAHFGSAEATEALLARGANVGARTKNDDSDVSEEARRVFIERGTSTAEEMEELIWRNNGETVLHLAAYSDNRRIIAALLEAGADVYQRDGIGDSPLHGAAWADAGRAVYELVARGANVDARGSRGETPMHKAAGTGSVAVIHELAVQGADVDARDEDARTPLHLAVYFGKLEAAIALLKREADIEARSVGGYTPLHLAVVAGNETGDYNAVEVLFRARAEINARADNGLTVLHLLADANKAEGIEALCNLKDNRANADIWDVDGNTPLHYAAAKNFTESIRVLVRACEADVNSENRFSQTPLDLAVDEDNQAAIAELQKHNAQRGPKS